MKTELNIRVRAFPVRVCRRSGGPAWEEQIVLTRQQLRAARSAGQSSAKLIGRLCSRAGLTVLEIGTPERREITVDLHELYRAHCRYLLGRRGKAEREQE